MSRSNSTEAQRVVVDRFYRFLGLEPCWDQRYLQPEGVVYSNGKAALLADVSWPGMALHDAAHWLVASEDRKNLHNWGLGPAVHVMEPTQAKRVVSLNEADNEEGLASLLQVLIVWFLLGKEEFRDCAKELSVDYIENYTDNHEHFHKLVEMNLVVLNKKGFEFKTFEQLFKALESKDIQVPLVNKFLEGASF